MELYDQTKWNFKSARKNNETIKLKRILRVREILTKQWKQRESLECARYYQDNSNKENPQSACDTSENNRTKGHPKSASRVSSELAGNKRIKRTKENRESVGDTNEKIQ